jgi:O-antigen biosynthesis protein
LKIKYNYKKFTPKNLDRENIDRLAVEKIPDSSKVLDVGCATGAIGEYLIKEKKCLVYGVEMRADEANIAKKVLTDVVIIDIEQSSSVEEILDMVKGEKFDVILATSVIEHLKDQTAFLKKCKKLLKQKGMIVASTPNIAHWTTRLSLLKGNFDYTEYGILDNTHLHFFTIKTFRQLFEDNSFTVKSLLIDSVGGGYPRISRILAKLFPGMFAYQILVIAQNN